jgi:hypothetical protein
VAGGGAGIGEKGGAAMSPLRLRDLMSSVWQGLLLLVLLTALLHIERVLQSIDLAITRLDSHVLVPCGSVEAPPIPAPLQSGETP